MSKGKLFFYIITTAILVGCADYKLHYSEGNGIDTNTVSKKRSIDKTFYFIGDAGGAASGGTTDALQALKTVVDTASGNNSYTIFLGDNIYDEGLPSKESKESEDAEHKINTQIESVANFDGKVFFIPGNHDWRDSGLKGVKRQEKYIEEALNDKNAFQPENGCPIKKVKISEDIVMLLLDTQWYLADWDKHPTINDNCDIKTRHEFFLAIEGEFKKNNEKTIIVAMHHPMFTNGVHGGRYAIEKHLFPSKSKIPLPGLASLVTQFRQQGVSVQDRANKRYSELMNRIETLSYDTKKVIFASGHEHSLQFIDHDGIKQIVSGSGAKTSAKKLGNDGLFSYGGQGFAVLDVFKDGSSEVRYFSAENGQAKLIYKNEVHPAWEEYDTSSLPTTFGATKKATVYDKEDTDKSKRYVRSWGDHYRAVYGTDVEVPVVTLDTLFGGFTVDRKGGGHQTRSLRLISPEGKNYAMRAVKKSAVQFLQSTVFTENFVQEEFRETFTEDLIQDFYTASHPFASLAVGGLADAIGVYHTNPSLVWMPKHPALGKYNSTYGDELYILEERPDKGFVDVASFGNPDTIESTSDMLANIRKNEEFSVDQESFVRTRLFDMLLGDWDRHADQWRWARFDKDGKKVYRPIPRDRDQIFSNYDGKCIDIIQALVPTTRKFQVYDGDLKNVKWINIAGSKLDIALLPNTTRETWIEQAKHIQENLTDTDIDEAFKKFPKEVHTPQLEEVKAMLKERRSQMASIADRYYDHLSKLVVLKGTDKDDHFEITREEEGTRVQISRIKGGEIQEPYVDRLLSPSETKEIWIYGLDDDDTFHVSGKGKKPILTRIVGGQNNDSYTIDDGRRIKIYDHKEKPNTIVKKGGATIRQSSIYKHNTYDFNKTITKINTVLPFIGANPDDGFIIGAQDTYIITGLKNDPFHKKHFFKAGYFSSTQGLEFAYKGEFADVIKDWNLLVGGRHTTGSFARNFFGFGNDTENNDDTEDLELDFNRVRTEQTEVNLGFVKDNSYGSRIRLETNFQRVEVEETAGRFIERDFINLDPEFFEPKNFAGVEGAYSYHNTDNGANPTRGVLFDTAVGSTLNLDDTDRIFGYVKPSLTFYNALTRNKKLVLRTQAQGQFNIGDDFEFYQAATLGASNGLRGFRNERFTGESALVGSADVRYSFNRFKTGLLPVQIGLYAGGDVGRVWLDGEDSDEWHNDIGGGFWVNAVDLISGQFGVFNSDDGIRLNFVFAFNF